MSKTGYGTDQHDLSANELQYNYGNKLFSTDIDSIQYTYVNNKIKICAIFDYKIGILNGNPSPITEQSSFGVYRLIAEQNDAPFFIVVCFTRQEYYIKTYYLHPANKQAEDALIKIGKFEDRLFSELQYAIFQHKLRGIKFNPNEIRNGKRLGDLSNKVNKDIKLPVILVNKEKP